MIEQTEQINQDKQKVSKEIAPTEFPSADLSSSPFDSISGSLNAVTNEPSLVPINITIGLAVFAVVLSLAGYVVRLLMGDELSNILSHALKLVPTFVIGVPALFWVSSKLMNRFSETKIQTRNALTFGWLISCVTMLWLMGTYS